MANEKYIKVTPKGETESRVILANLRNFYISQGAKIETPSAAEIADAFPNEEKEVVKYQRRTEDARHAAEIAQWKENATKQAERINELIKKNTSLSNENSTLKEKVATLEASLTETEQLVEKLREEQKPSKRASRYDKTE